MNLAKWMFNSVCLLKSRSLFGKVIQLNRENFVDAIDKEHQSVAVIIHISSPVSYSILKYQQTGMSSLTK